MPSYFPENNIPTHNDNEVRSLQKINDLLANGFAIPPYNDVVFQYNNSSFPTKPTYITFKQDGTDVYALDLSYDANGALTRVFQD